MAFAASRIRKLVKEEREDAVRSASAAFRLSAALAVVAAVAAASTAFIPGVLHGTAVMNGSARGTGYVVLGVALPVLLVAMFAGRRGSIRATIVWLGAVAYLLYNAVLFLFATPFNSLFLLYTSMFTLAVWSAVAVLRTLRVEQLGDHFSNRLPVRAIAGYLGLVAILNALVWLSGVVPALISSKEPAFLAGTGLTTNPIYVQDLTFWIPLSLVAAVSIWRRRPWGYVLAGALLIYLVLESTSIAVDQWFGHAADPSSAVASAALVPGFVLLALIGLIPTVFYMRGVQR
jgi:hypothetical protein